MPISLSEIRFASDGFAVAVNDTSERLAKRVASSLACCENNAPRFPRSATNFLIRSIVALSTVCLNPFIILPPTSTESAVMGVAGRISLGRSSLLAKYRCGVQLNRSGDVVSAVTEPSDVADHTHVQSESAALMKSCGENMVLWLPHGPKSLLTKLKFSSIGCQSDEASARHASRSPDLPSGAE